MNSSGFGAPNAALGIADRLLALETAVAELQKMVGAGIPAPTPEPSGVEQLAQQLGNARLAAVLVRAGYTSPAAVAAAPDEALQAIDGIGAKALKLIRQNPPG
jgi:hypothetical protein